MAIEAGKTWLVYLNTGTEASPSWSVITECRDITFDITSNTSDTTTRSCSGWVRNSPTTREMAAGFSIILDYTVSNHITLVEAAHNQTLKGFKFVGGTAQNWIFYGYLDASFAPALDGYVEVSFTIHPSTVPVYAAS